MSSAYSPRRDGRVGIARLARPGNNPYLALLEEKLRTYGFPVVTDPPFTLRWLWQARRNIAFLHFHWRPDTYYVSGRRRRPGKRVRPVLFQRTLTWLKLARFAGRLLAARALGYRVVWTIHEVFPPETGRRRRGSISRRVDRIAERFLARQSQLLLAHDAVVAENARSELKCPTLDIEIVPHGSYVGVYPPGRLREEVRAELRLAGDGFVFLCFGVLRPEKDIPLLLAAFQGLELPDVMLVIAGKPADPAAVRETLRACRADSRIRTILGEIPTGRVAELFAAADAAVLPRSQTWTSGSLILALSLGVPVVAARLPAYEQMLDGERGGWLFRPGDVDSLRETLERAAGEPHAARGKGEAARRRAEGLPSWDEIARLTVSLMYGARAAVPSSLAGDPASGLPLAHGARRG